MNYASQNTYSFLEPQEKLEKWIMWKFQRRLEKTLIFSRSCQDLQVVSTSSLSRLAWLKNSTKIICGKQNITSRPPLEEAHILISRTCESIMLNGSGELRLQMELRLLTSWH